ncbi:MAG: PorT family protein [Bacteroides sp.]|nr:PorT family protein [Bacteroides sp.]
MTNYYKDFICYLLFICCAIPLSAQHNMLVLRDTISKRDTIINDVTFKKMTPYNRQQGVLVTVWLNEKESVRSYTPTQVSKYVENGITYKSKTLVHKGEKKQLLLPEVYQRDSISIYMFMPEEEEKLYYISIGDNSSLLIPMQDSQRRKGTNAVRTYLESFPLSKEKTVKAYISKMKPTPASFDDRYEVVTSGNPNAITYFRWGIQGGTGFSSFNSKSDFNQDISYTNEISYFAGLFLDIPITNGVSFHPEVNLQHYAHSYQSETSSKQQTKSYIAYNRNDISIPILIRYTLRSIRGKWLPYIQVGPKLDFSLKRDLDELALNSTTLKINGTDETIKSWSDISHKQDKFNLGINTGIGVEWKVSLKNSLFFDVRYIRDFTEDRINGYYFSLAINL